jgi:hypothetical protein
MAAVGDGEKFPRSSRTEEPSCTRAFGGSGSSRQCSSPPFLLPLLFSSDGGGLNWGEDPLAARSGRRDGVWYIKGGTLGFGGVE